ncbi:MAG: SF1B family DNA helicase RecD2 [Deltaproteobacteria bacterium]
MAEPITEESLEGTVERIVFRSQGGGFTVARLRTDRALVTAVGALPGVAAGGRIRVTGSFVEDPRYGTQLKVSSCTPLLPSGLEGLERHLASGAFTGIGPVLAKRIVEQLGEDAFEVLDGDLERLAAVPGLGPRRAMELSNQWRAAHAERELLLFLHSHSLPPSLAGRLFGQLGSDALTELREHPYAAALSVPGIGFRLADRIALALGTPLEAPVRAANAALQALSEAVDSGHVFLPGTELSRRLERLGIPPEATLAAIDQLSDDGRVLVERDEEEARIFPAGLHRAEVDCARLLRVLGMGAPPGEPLDGPEALVAVEESALVRLSPGQRAAVAAALAEKLLVLTGGPGTGKTTLVRALLRLWKLRGVRPLLAAPTGRAAKRLFEATGHPASTLHRLLEWNPARADFARGQKRPLDAEVVLVDEASMLDLPLLQRLLLAMPPAGQLVFVGDADQLPSVGPGAVLRDVLASDAVAAIRLTEVFRQADRSLITENAHRIRRGELPVSGEPGADFVFLERDRPEEAAEAICELVAHELPKSRGLAPRDDIQVLSPMHRGSAGTRALNDALQQALNPTGPSLSRGERAFRLGDRVMQLRNDYEREIFNGDIGRISAVDPASGGLRVDFDGRAVACGPDDLGDLTLAYACSVHKAQGSEYPAIVLALLSQHQPMLQRNLLYTAVTRARRLAVVVGSRRALARAVENARQGERFTRLAERLRGLA